MWEKKALLGFILLHNHIRNSGVYNFQGCRIPIHSNLNIEFWRMKLVDYRDYRICDFLEFGWPVGHIGMLFESSYCRNHKGATDFPDDIKNCLKKESSYKAIVGPFKSNPFNEPIAVSPINSVPKKERRVIVDLSFPEDTSVNNGILKEQYLEETISVQYPTVDNLIDLVKKGKVAIFSKGT